jgi:LmbE family N-acetylglucosaminyl deacetylase
MSAVLDLNKQDRLLVLAVHPDDETLAAAGLIQQALAAGAEVRVVFVTDGDNNPWPQRFLERRWRIDQTDRARWGQIRRQEALAALAMLGVHPQNASFLGFPDQGLTALLTTNDGPIINRLIAEITDWQPSVLVGPALEDHHPDHNALAVLVDFALEQLPDPETRPFLLTYLVHSQETPSAIPYAVNLTERQIEHKRQAILCHATQTALSRWRLLRYARKQEVYFSPPLLGSQSAGRYQAMHPVYEVSPGANLLNIHIRLPGLLHRLGETTLYLIAEDAPEQAPSRTRLRMTLNGDSGFAEIYDCTSNAVVGQANIRVEGGMIEAGIPLDLLTGARSFYLKLERRWGFFDVAGWRKATINATRPAIGVVGIIPCYDVEDYCEQVILQAINYIDHLIVINDGSTDNTANILSRLMLLLPDRISVITFPSNKGKGVGLIAGFCEALNRFDFQTLVTLDADGQHPPAEIPHLVHLIESGAEMAIGERRVENMPGRSRLGNTLATGAIRWLYPLAPTDTQSGLRAFTQAFVQEIVRMVAGSRYETEFQILLLALSQQRHIATVSIPTIYIDNNRSSKFRPIADSLRIMHALIRWRFSRTSKTSHG